MAAVWLDLLLCLTFSLPNEWLGSSIDHGGHQHKCAASFSGINSCPFDHLVEFVGGTDWTGGRLGLRSVLWLGMPLLYHLLPTDLPRGQSSSLPALSQLYPENWPEDGSSSFTISPVRQDAWLTRHTSKEAKLPSL